MKLLVDPLPNHLDTDEVVEFFKPFGNPTCVIKRQPTCYGILTFQKQEDLEKCLSESHKIGDFVLKLSRFQPENGKDSNQKENSYGFNNNGRDFKRSKSPYPNRNYTNSPYPKSPKVDPVEEDFIEVKDSPKEINKEKDQKDPVLENPFKKSIEKKKEQEEREKKEKEEKEKREKDEKLKREREEKDRRDREEKEKRDREIKDKRERKEREERERRERDDREKRERREREENERKRKEQEEKQKRDETREKEEYNPNRFSNPVRATTVEEVFKKSQPYRRRGFESDDEEVTQITTEKVDQPKFDDGFIVNLQNVLGKMNKDLNDNKKEVQSLRTDVKRLTESVNDLREILKSTHENKPSRRKSKKPKSRREISSDSEEEEQKKKRRKRKKYESTEESESSSDQKDKKRKKKKQVVQVDSSSEEEEKKKKKGKSDLSDSELRLRRRRREKREKSRKESLDLESEDEDSELSERVFLINLLNQVEIELDLHLNHFNIFDKFMELEAISERMNCIMPCEDLSKQFFKDDEVYEWEFEIGEEDEEEEKEDGE